MSERYHQILPEGSLEFFRGLPRKLGQFVTRTLLSPYPLNPPSSYEHPLDEPIEQVVASDWTRPTIERPEAGQLNRWDSLGDYLRD